MKPNEPWSIDWSRLQHPKMHLDLITASKVSPAFSGLSSAPAKRDKYEFWISSQPHPLSSPKLEQTLGSFAPWCFMNFYHHRWIYLSHMERGGSFSSLLPFYYMQSNSWPQRNQSKLLKISWWRKVAFFPLGVGTMEKPSSFLVFPKFQWLS